MVSLGLKRFDLNSIRDDAMILIIGKRENRKTALMKDILRHKQHCTTGIVMGPTVNRNFRDLIPECHIHDDFNLPAVESMLARQARIAWDKGESALIVADNCMNEKKKWNTTAIHNCFMNGRQMKLFGMFTVQSRVDVPPELRSNTDYVFVFHDSNPESVERLYRCFFGMFENKKEFTHVFNQLTATEYDFLVLDLTRGSYAVEDCVFWGRAADVHPPRTHQIAHTS